MSQQAGGGFDYKIIPSQSKANMKWLNVVLELNGILHACQEEWLMLSGTLYAVSDLSHSTNVLYLIGKKVVYVRPSY